MKSGGVEIGGKARAFISRRVYFICRRGSEKIRLVNEVPCSRSRDDIRASRCLREPECKLRGSGMQIRLTPLNVPPFRSSRLPGTADLKRRINFHKFRHGPVCIVVGVEES